MNNEKWLNTKTLAKEFGIAESTQSRYRANRTIPFSKIGGFIFYSRDKIYEWLEKHSFDADGEMAHG